MTLAEQEGEKVLGTDALQAVCAYDYIDAAVGNFSDDLFLLPVTPEALKHFDRDREGLKPIGKRFQVLLGQHRSGNQDRNLST